MKKLTPEEFVSSFANSPNDSRIYHNDGEWEAHCPDGVLAKPDGSIGFINLQGLMSILAGIGIRRCDVEWDGLPAWHYGQSNSEVN